MSRKFLDLSVSLQEGIKSDPDFMLPKINYQMKTMYSSSHPPATSLDFWTILALSFTSELMDRFWCSRCPLKISTCPI